MDFTLNKDQHFLVKNSDGNVLVDDEGNWLVSDTKANTVIAIPPSEELIKFFSNDGNTEDLSEYHIPLDIPSCSSTKDTNAAAKWEKQETILLLHLFKKHKVDTKTNKNDIAWKLISNELAKSGFVFTPHQCETRFKYLRGRYVKKIDNMGAKGTGESPIYFEYLDEMNDIFGKKPNIVPLAIASSLRGSESESESKQNEPPHKKSRLEKEVAHLSELLLKTEERKEAAQNKRHNERLAKSEEAINVYQTMMQKLIDKL